MNQRQWQRRNSKEDKEEGGKRGHQKELQCMFSFLFYIKLWRIFFYIYKVSVEDLLNSYIGSEERREKKGKWKDVLESEASQ